MHSRAATVLVLAVAAATFALAGPALADQTSSLPAMPTSPALSSPVLPANNTTAEVNRRLAVMLATAPNPRAPQGSQAPGASAAASTPGVALARTTPSRLLTPALLNLVARYTKAEHLLHIQRGGLDANFWNAFSREHSVHVRYVIHF